MSSDGKEHIRDKLRCRLNDAVASARPRESATIFSVSPVLFVGAQARVSVYLSAFTFLSVVCIEFFALLLFCFLDKAGVFVGSSIVVPPVFSFFLRVYHVHLFFVCFLSLPASSSAFITSSFLLRICAFICLFLFLEGFL